MLSPDRDNARSTLLAIDRFSLTFHDAEGNRFPVLHDISLRIAAGESHALVGESGSGKSVTALSILRLLEETNEVEHS
jgi:microcin C transport system ATP-binding protein